MTVTKEGVKGYEYQYKVTILISLISAAEKIDLFVEKEGSEDALLVLENKGVKQYIEIQVKRESNLIDLPKLVNWLCHFQERKSDINLLQKLINEKQIIALFVTHSRCSDDTVKIKTDFLDINRHKTLSVTENVFKEFKKVLRNQTFGTTSLMKKRQDFCQKQSDLLISKENLNTILEQCLILEEFSDTIVDNYITSLLNSKYNVAQSRTNLVYLKLLEIVKHGRDTGVEIYKAISELIQINKIGSPNVDSLYKKRKEEEFLIDTLKLEGILLLTGISQCGKTELAKTISAHFVKEGFDYQIHNDISELKRYLNSNIPDNKIAILEDPFGHISLKENHFDTLRKLNELIANKEKHHFIIVSSRIEVLFELFETQSIANCKIKNIDWFDLTLKNNEEVEFYWKLLAKDKLLSDELISLVSKGIRNTKSENLLQIGQLVYLVNEEVDNITNKGFNDLEHIARRDSKEIAKNLKLSNEYAAEVLSIISICSTPIQDLQLTDLSYILSDIKELLSILDRDDFSSTFCGDEIIVFPKYSHDTVLGLKALDAIGYLEERGFILLLKESLIITHPNYYEAGRYLFFEKGLFKQKIKLEWFKKCLGCLNTSTAYQATENYSFIYNKIRTELKNEIFKIAYLGLNSIFPSVEDNSLIFLTNFIHEVGEEHHRNLIYRIQIGGTDSSHIYWYNDIPFISYQSGFQDIFVGIDNSIIQKVDEQLTHKLLPNIHDAWIYIEGLKDQKHISLEKIIILLQYNEAFVREKVVYQIFNRPNILDKKIIFELFNDEHPTVVFSTIRASLINWFSLTIEIKEFILELTIRSLLKKQIAIRAFNLMSTFSIDYSHESIMRRDYNKPQRQELWNVWGELFPSCLENVPLEVHINTARFGASMDDSIEFLNLETGMKVIEAWYKRIDYQVKNNKMLDEYEMSIADNLMKLTSNKFEIRKDIFLKLINYDNTSFLLSNLKWLVGYWSDLHDSEKELIVNLTLSGREDLRWIKAVLLNSYTSTPKEITQSILGIDKLDTSNVRDIIHLFPDQLLKDCLNVYCGFPQPLWWLAVHHHNTDFWGKIIRIVLERENNIGFEICLQAFLSNGVNGFNDEWKDWLRIWKRLCKTVVNKQLLVDTLIFNTARCSCSLYYSKALWSVIINSYKAINRENEIIEIVASKIEILQQTGRKEDLFKIFNGKFIWKVFMKLQPDFLIYELLKVFKHSSSFGQEITEVFDKLEIFLQQVNIRFFITFNYINNLIADNKVPEELKFKLKSLPNEIDEIGKLELEKLTHIEEYKLDNWIGIN